MGGAGQPGYWQWCSITALACVGKYHITSERIEKFILLIDLFCFDRTRNVLNIVQFDVELS